MQSPNPWRLKASVHVCIHLLLLLLLPPLPSPPNSPQCWALRAHTGCTCKKRRGACGNTAPPSLPLPPTSPPPQKLLSLLKKFLLLHCCKFLGIIVSSKGSNSERQFQQHYNNTGTPPLWAPVLSSITPLCPSDTSGVSLQRLHQHTHTQPCTNQSTDMNTCGPDGAVLHYLVTCL